MGGEGEIEGGKGGRGEQTDWRVKLRIQRGRGRNGRKRE